MCDVHILTNSISNKENLWFSGGNKAIIGDGELEEFYFKTSWEADGCDATLTLSNEEEENSVIEDRLDAGVVGSVVGEASADGGGAAWTVGGLVTAEMNEEIFSAWVSILDWTTSK